MYISLNELQSTSSKALEARCLGNSSCTALAANITKLEAMGYLGVELFLAALDNPYAPARWRRHEQGLSFDHSPDIVQSAALGYYLAEQLQTTEQSYSVGNAAAVARWLLPTFARQWQRAGYCCQLEWVEANIAYRAQVDSQGLAWASRPDANFSNDLKLIKLKPEPNWQSQLEAQAWQVHSHQQCARSYSQSLQRGLSIAIDHWHKLQKHAEAVLVPDNPSSSQDAGADAASIDEENKAYSQPSST